MKQSTTGRYLVKPHNPWQQWTLRSIWVLFVIAVMWGVYEFGIVNGGHHRTTTNSKIAALNDQVAMLAKRIEELTLENAQLVSDSAIKSTANEQVSVSLRELNDETLELKEELMFYRSLLSPADLEPGLQILGAKLVKAAGATTYDYNVVLTQRHNKNKYASGRVELVISGTQNEEGVQLQTTDVLEVGESELNFRFKNFQNLEGRLNLPDNFEPLEMIVTAVPRSRSLKKVERNYKWNSIVTGG